MPRRTATLQVLRTERLTPHMIRVVAGGERRVAALTTGYHLASTVAIGAAVASILLAVVLLRRHAGRGAALAGCHDIGHAGSLVITRQTFWPPKPNELEMARVTLASRATFGTTSSGIAGSGT